MSEDRVVVWYLVCVILVLALFLGLVSSDCHAFTGEDEVRQGETWEPGGYSRVYLPYLRRIEESNGLPRNLLVAVADQESNFDPYIVSCRIQGAVGELGMFQIRPEWHPEVDPCNPIEAAQYAARWLLSMKNNFGSWEAALIGYNWGPGNLAKWLRGGPPPPRSSAEYASEIIWKVFGKEI